jgi:CRP-like cAMP-binding protein
MAVEDTLASVDLFSRLERHDLARLAKTVVQRSYKQGEEIVKEGEQAVAFYVIVKGKVAITKSGKPLDEMGPGESFGDMALLDGFPRVASVVAQEPTDCLVMTRWDFTAELRTNPSIALAMLPILSKRIRELDERLVG